jgi:hypothetical protein
VVKNSTIGWNVSSSWIVFRLKFPGVISDSMIRSITHLNSSRYLRSLRGQIRHKRQEERIYFVLLNAWRHAMVWEESTILTSCDERITLQDHVFRSSCTIPIHEREFRGHTSLRTQINER